MAIPISARPVLPILLIEGDEDFRKAVTTILRLEGHLLLTAANGQLALDAVIHAQYSLILLDMVTPTMNSFEFLAAYADQPGAHSPVIVFSDEADEITAALPSFVMDVLHKPFQVGHLPALVSKYMQPVWRELGPQ